MPLRTVILAGLDKVLAVYPARSPSRLGE
jgi:hypothetical protein